MLKDRLSGSRWVIWLRDPAVAMAIATNTVTSEQVYKYASSRDLDDLGGMDAVSKWPEPPTLFLVRAMDTRMEYVSDNPEMLFAFAVEDMKNCTPSWRQWGTSAGGHRHLEDDARNLIPLDCVRDIGALVKEMATADGDSLPFSWPDGWQRQLSASIARAVIAARLRTVGNPATVIAS